MRPEQFELQDYFWSQPGLHEALSQEYQTKGVIVIQVVEGSLTAQEGLCSVPTAVEKWNNGKMVPW